MRSSILGHALGIGIGLLLISTPWSRAMAQFPISQPATGDTIYPIVIQPFHVHVEPRPNDLLMVIYINGSPWLLAVDDNGTIAQDMAIDTLLIAPLGANLTDSGLVITGRYQDHPFLGVTTGQISSFAWTANPVVNGSFSRTVIVLDNGDVLASGSEYLSANAHIPFIQRYTPAGALLWTNTGGLGSISGAGGPRELPDGSILLTGNTGDPTGNSFRALCKRVSATGSNICINAVGTTGFTSGDLVLPSDQDHSIIIGNQEIPNNLFLTQVVNANCDEVWTKVYSGMEMIDALFDTTQSTYTILGYRPNGLGNFIGKFDLNGDSLWTQGLGNASAPLTDISFDGFGGYFIGGNVSDQAYLLRVDASGIVQGIIDPVSRSTGLRIAPNPSSGPIRVTYLMPFHGDLHWELLDACGRSIDHGLLPRNGELVLEHQDFPAGICLFRLSNGATARMIVQ